MAGNCSHSGPNKNLPGCQCLKLDKDSEKEGSNPFAQFMENNSIDYVPLQKFIQAKRKGNKDSGDGSALSSDGSCGDGSAPSHDGSGGKGCGMQRINSYLKELIQTLENEDKMENKEQGNRNDNWQILSYTMEN